MAYWKPITGLKEPIPIRTFNGVYCPDDEGFNLPDGTATDMSNISALEYPAISTRPGFSLIGNALGGRVTGLGAYKDNELHSVANGVWRRWNGSSWDDLASTLSSSADCSFANFQGNFTDINLIMANGVDAPRKYNGSTVTTLSGAPANGNFVTQHDNRCYMAAGSTVYYSALRKAEDWSTAGDAGQIVVETTSGESINGMIAGPKRLTVFKPNAIFELFGTGPKEFELVQQTNDIGAVNNKSIINLGGLIYFLHTTGIYTYGGSRPRNDFSVPVNKLVRRMNQAAKDKCSIGTDGTYLYVAIPLDNATEVNTILVYSIIYNVWYVWNGFTTTQMIKIGTDLYQGDAIGRVTKLGGTTDAGTPISFKWVSKPFTATSMARSMNWYNLWDVLSMDAGASLNVYLSRVARGDSDWQLVKQFTAPSEIRSQRLQIPVNMVANSTFVRVKLEGVGQVATHDLIRQYREMPWR